MDLEKQTVNTIMYGGKCIGPSDKSVLFLGLAGSGKTTLVRLLLNIVRRMKVLQDGRRTRIQGQGIGADRHNSTTKIPHCYEEDGKRYYDCPGFRGTQGAAHRLATTYLIKAILDASKQVKLVLVVDHYAGHKELIELLAYATSFIKDVEKFSKSILFVSTGYISGYVSCELPNCRGSYACKKCSNRPTALSSFKQTLEELWKELNRYNVDLGHERPFGLSRDRLKIITALLAPNKNGFRLMPIDQPSTMTFNEDSYWKQKSNAVWEAIESLEFCEVEPNDFCYGLSGLEEMEVVRLIEDSSETVCKGITSFYESVSTYFDKIAEASQSFHLLTKKINRNCDALKRMKEELVRTKTLDEFASHLFNELGFIRSVELSKARENLLKKLNWFKIWLNYLPAGNHETVCRKLKDCVSEGEKKCYNHKIWCSTLKQIYDDSCSYDRQLERYKYDVTDISDWGRGKLEDQQESSLLRINANNVYRFLSILFSPSMGDEQQLPPSELMDGQRLDHLKHLIHVTIKSANKIHFSNGVLSVQGNFVRSSLVLERVNQLLQEGSSVISIRVEALHTIYIDSNFELEACQLTLISPHIETIGGRKITLIASTGDSNPSSFLCVTRTLQGSLEAVTGTNGLESHDERTGVSVTGDEPTRKVYGEPLIEPKTGCNSIFLCRRVEVRTPNVVQDAPDLISHAIESYSFLNTDRMYTSTSSGERGQGNATIDIRYQFANIVNDYKMNILKHLNDFWLGEPLHRFIEDTLCHHELDSLYSYTLLREEFEYLNQNNSMHQDQIRLLSFYKALSQRIERLNDENNDRHPVDNRGAMDSLQNDLKLVMEDTEQSIARKFSIDIPGYFESQLSKVMDFNQLKSTLKSLKVNTGSGDRIHLKINDLISSKKQKFDSDLQATYQTAEYLRSLDSEDSDELP